MAGQGQGVGRHELGEDQAAGAPVPQGLPSEGSTREDERQDAVERETRGRYRQERGGAHRGRHGDGQGRAALCADSGGQEDQEGADPEAADKAGGASEQGADQGGGGRAGRIAILLLVLYKTLNSPLLAYAIRYRIVLFQS